MEYLIDGNGLVGVPGALARNNPAMPFPDCVGLKVVYQNNATGATSDVMAQLRFGSHQLTATAEDKSFAFSVSLRKAKLRLLAVEGLRINHLSTMGTNHPKKRSTLKTTLTQEKRLTSDAKAKVNAALSGERSPLNILQAVVGLGLQKRDQSILLSKLQSSTEFTEFEVGFDERGNPVWHILPRIDFAETFRKGDISRAGNVAGEVIKFGDGRLFNVTEIRRATAKPMSDACLLFGISAHVRDVEVEVNGDADSSWWQDILSRRGFREKKQVAQAAIRNIIAREIKLLAPDHHEGNLLFAVAAAEPCDIDDVRD